MKDPHDRTNSVEYIEDLPEKAGSLLSAPKIKRPTKLSNRQKAFIKRIADWYNDDHVDWVKPFVNKTKHFLYKFKPLVNKMVSRYHSRTPKFIELKVTDKIYFKFSWTFIIGLLVFGYAIWPHSHQTIAQGTHKPPLIIQGVGRLDTVNEPIKPLSAPQQPAVEPYIIPVPRPLGDDVPGNGYDACNCTYWVKSKRHDLPNNLGNADMWAINAKAYGFKVTDEPKAGAAAQVRGSMHVVYVESVNPDGTVNVSAMNENGPCSMAYYTAPASRFIFIW